MSMGPDDTEAGVAPVASTLHHGVTHDGRVAERGGGRGDRRRQVRAGSGSRWPRTTVPTPDVGIDAVVVTLLSSDVAHRRPRAVQLVGPGTWPPEESGGGVVGIVTLPAVTITGEMGEASGGPTAMPEGALSSGYAVHVQVEVAPRDHEGQVDSRVLGDGDASLLVAVKGPTVIGVDGTVKGTPDGGTGLGRGTSKLNGPVGSEAGVAPWASIVAVAVPLRSTCSRGPPRPRRSRPARGPGTDSSSR